MTRLPSCGPKERHQPPFRHYNVQAEASPNRGGTAADDDELNVAARMRFLELLGELSAEERQVVVLRHLQRLDRTASAQVLNMTSEQVRTTYARAMQKLYDWLDRD
jgi:RNA polymerase sigma factor (sigma-70 family)